MSRQNFRKRTNVKLPPALQKELGLQGANSTSRHDRRKHGGNTVTDRKERRRASRVGKRCGGHQQRDGQVEEYQDSELSVDHDDVDNVGIGRNQSSSDAGLSTLVSGASSTKSTQTTTTLKPKSILKRATNRPESSVLSESESSRASSPGLVLDPNSRSFKKHAEEDDDEIAALERRLGIRGNKKSALGDDVLDFVLEDLDGESEGRKRKREGQEWLDKKRIKIQEKGDSSDQETGEGKHTKANHLYNQDLDDPEDEQSESDSGGPRSDFESIEGEILRGNQSEGDDFEGFESGSDEAIAAGSVKIARENPYIAPIVPGSAGGKYVPPSLRKQLQGDDSKLESLRRLLQGQLNKLSEANMTSILGEIEKIYRTNPRQDVTTVLIERIFTSFCVRSALQNTFIILHAAFLAAVYKVMGTDFGAELLVKVAERFDVEYQRQDAGKEALNLISLLGNLFTFNVVSSDIIYGHIRLLMLDFSEYNAELLLRIARDCGPQLRSDDPTALKEIVQNLQIIVAEAAKNGQPMNIRMRVMVDTIVDLKNNKMKNATNAAGLTGEHITRMRKALGSLNNRTLKATEPLRITRDDIANSDKKGKWWLVGASWKGHDVKSNPLLEHVDENLGDYSQPSEVEEEVDFLALAKEYRMNTDVRRSIFVAIMAANDCRDAQMRLTKLRLSSKQEQEIAKVLLRCARAEPAYNPYYALLAKNLCKDKKKIRIGFQFGLWDFFSRLGERTDDDESDDGDDGDHGVELHEIVNIAKMYAYLIFHGHLTIGILKILNIGFLKERTTMFLEALLVSIMTQPKAKEEELIRVFSQVADTPQLVKPLDYFVKKNVKKSDLASGKDRAKIKAGCQIAGVAFKMADSTELD